MRFRLVVKLSPHRFKPREDANYLEYVYYPDKLDGERQKEIVDGLKDFLQTGDFSALPSPDKVNTSGKFKTTEEEDGAKFSIRNSSDLVNDISEKGLGGAVGKEAVGKFVDGLYMNDADIRSEINKGIGKAGFNYATATRNFLGDIANGEVSAETWQDAMVSAKALQDDIAEETQSPITDSKERFHDYSNPFAVLFHSLYYPIAIF